MQDQEQEVKTYAQMLKEGLDEVFSSEPYRRFLQFVANNPSYSYRNVLLILHQNPSATKVMGFKAWLKQGRCVQQGQRGLRITAKFEKDDEEELPPASARKKQKQKKERPFRRISVFDISQTISLESGNTVTASENDSSGDGTELFCPAYLRGSVDNFSLALEILREISPLPIRFQNALRTDGTLGEKAILIQDGMSQLHTIRTIVNQIVHQWRRQACPDREQLEIEAESVAFIVCQYLGLDTSEFSFTHIARYSLGRERKSLETFLDVIQQTAMYFIETFEGIFEAKKSSYDATEFFLISQKRAQRLLQMGDPVYLVFPEGELLTFDRKAIDQHDGLFATERAVWFTAECRAA